MMRVKGFTLIDTAMGLMVLGLLIAGAAAAFKLHLRDAQIKTTYANSELVARAMENFIHQNASFPCPAAVDLAPDNPMYGVSANCAALTGYDTAGNPGPAVAPGGFAGGIFVEEGTLDATRRIVRGMIPFKTLNLPESFAYDGHRQRLFYALSTDQANEVTFAADAGAIAVVGADGALGPTETQKTHFLIFSAGRDGRGAYAKSGAQILPCGAGLDAENCNTATGPNAKAIYRTAAAANTDGTATNFDDYFLPDNSIIIPLWKEDPTNDGNIHDIKGQKIVMGGDPADPKTAAILDVKIDVMGAARARVDELGAKGIGDKLGNAMADDYCDENKGACFGAELIAGNELAMDCNTAFGARPAGPAMTGIGDAEAKCGPLAFNFACPAGMALTGVGAGGAPICSYICAPDTESQFYVCPAPHTTGQVEERRDMDCTLAPPAWGPWMYYADNCCTPSSQTEPNAPCPPGYAGTYSRTRDYTCPAAAWGAWVPAAIPAPPSCIPIVNGVCGSADGQILATTPSGAGALCSAGADTPVSGGATGPVWTWDCNGTPPGFGTTDNCSATYGVNGVCGTANGGTFGSAPTNPALCNAGNVAVAPSGAGPWSWTCNGLGAGAPSPVCNASENLVNGTCGTANGGTFASAPTNPALCNTGTVAAAPSGAGPWNWTCNGSGGGPNSPACTAGPSGATSCGDDVSYHRQLTAMSMIDDDTVTCPATHRATTSYAGGPYVGPYAATRSWIESTYCVPDVGCAGGSCILNAGSTPTEADVVTDCASSLGYTQGVDFTSAYVVNNAGNYTVCHDNIMIMGLVCSGSYGGDFWHSGSNPVCAGAYPACPAGAPVNGVCGGTVGTCSAGAVTGDNGQTACGTTRSWTCDGSGVGHTDDVCNVANPACGGGCTLGPLVEHTGIPLTNVTWDGTAGVMAAPGPGNLCQATNYIATAHGGNEIYNSLAVCGSLNAGDFSPNGACLKSVWADCGGNLSCASKCRIEAHLCAGGPPVVNGACSGTPGLCSAGMPIADNGQTACGTTRTWTCDGSGVGHTDDTCNIPNPACATPGACGTANGGTFPTAPSGAALCNTGSVVTTPAGAGPWSWICRTAGGDSPTCNATQSPSCTANPVAYSGTGCASCPLGSVTLNSTAGARKHCVLPANSVGRWRDGSWRKFVPCHGVPFRGCLLNDNTTQHADASLYNTGGSASGPMCEDPFGQAEQWQISTCLFELGCEAGLSDSWTVPAFRTCSGSITAPVAFKGSLTFIDSVGPRTGQANGICLHGDVGRTLTGVTCGP